jgi:hypothetical protein
MSPARTTFAILASIAAALVLIVAGDGFAQDKDKLNKIADAIKKGDLIIAKKLATEYAKDHPDNEELMAAFQSAKKYGLGVGGKGGIEMEIRDRIKTPLDPADLKARAADFVRMTEHVTAVGFVSEAMGVTIPVKKGVPYTKLANDLVAAAQGFKKAVDAQDPAAVQKSAKMLDQACLACHNIYKP